METQASILAWEIPRTEEPRGLQSMGSQRFRHNLATSPPPIVALQCCLFLLYSKVNQLYIYTYPLSFGFPSHLGYRRVLSRVLCVIQWVLISSLSYTKFQYCVYINSNLRIHPTTPPSTPLVSIICYFCLCVYFCFAKSFICTIFLDFTYMHQYTIFTFLFFTLLCMTYSRSTHNSTNDPNEIEPCLMTE